ncbi:MAG: asparagine synthase (glutamine-hydrolyzing) [Candidatus Nealsonbacteria bacterium]|nr:asparagine synthase (glutamine-hydrolyzing) [Candidatus Nealsonbacteria bacterium]
MCGIVGVYDYCGKPHAIRTDVFDRMVDSLAHRGPDGRGTWHDDGIALGHRRLAILDPTPAGAQPMRDPQRSLVVTYNGEIYNFRQLRDELSAHGHRFRTNCDTEVLLAAYAEWGTEAVSRLNGIFAFALWDAPRRRLWMARDRLGVKPLCYSFQGGVFRFASEVKALLADPEFRRRPSPAGMDAFLSFGFVPAPLSAFADVAQLPPASELLIENGASKLRQYWRPSMAEVPCSSAEAQEQFAHHIHEAVSRQMVADVPLGGFLSGGIDSAAVVSEMAADNTEPVHTFSVSFAEKSFDEGPAAVATARQIGTQHRQIDVELNLEETLDRFVDHCDEPFADSSSLAVYHLCRVASSEVKVALSGDGADELLAGYPTYSATCLAAAYRRFPRWSRAWVRRLVSAMPVSEKRYAMHQFANRFVLGAEEGEGRDFSSWRVHFRHTDKQTVCKPHFLQRRDDPIELYAAAYRDAPDAQSRLKRMLYADLAFYLPNDMLVKVDRMSMAHGLEVRVPFLDHQLVEYCVGLPNRLLARLPLPRRNKLILRRHLNHKLGGGVARRRKTGFNVPIEKAMRGPFLSRFHDVVTAKPFCQDGPFDVPRLVEYARHHADRSIDAGHALFGAMVLAHWWERWL